MCEFYRKLLYVLSILVVYNAVNGCSRKKGSASKDLLPTTITTTQPNTPVTRDTHPPVNLTWKSHVLIVQRSFTELMQLPVIFICGGTLINQHTILTAANCFHKELELNGRSYNLAVNESHFTVYLGAHNIEFIWDESTTLESSVLVRKVSKIITYPSFDSRKKLNDIALFILDKKVESNEQIRPAHLPHKGSNFPGYNKHACFLLGWGKTVEDEGKSNNLLNLSLETYEPRICSELSSYQYFDEKSQICAVKFEAVEDGCEGFSGSGLYAFDKNHQIYITFGIVSNVYGCDRKNTPSTYTRISHYFDWIHHNWMH